MKLLSVLALVCCTDARKKITMIPAPSKGAAAPVIPVVEVPVVEVAEMIPSYAPPEPSNVIVMLDNQPAKDHIIHGEPDRAPGLPSRLPVEQLNVPNWRPVAIAKPPAQSPQFSPRYAFGKEPGPLFDRPGKMHRVGDASKYIDFEKY